MTLAFARAETASNTRESESALKAQTACWLRIARFTLGLKHSMPIISRPIATAAFLPRNVLDMEQTATTSVTTTYDPPTV